jgi:hypothetical protein
MTLQISDSTRTDNSANNLSSVKILSNITPKAVTTPEKSHDPGEVSSTTPEQLKKVDKHIKKIQKGTWRKIKDWFTRAYRISEVAKKKPERVRSAGKHILIFGMLVGLAPSVISSIARSIRGDKESQKRSPSKKKEKPISSAKKKSERLRVITPEGEESTPEQTTVSIGNQLYVILSSSKPVTDQTIAYTTAEQEHSTFVLTNTNQRPESTESETSSALLEASVFINTAAARTIQDDQSLDISYSITSPETSSTPEEKTLKPEIKTHVEEEKDESESSSWKDQKITLTLYPDFNEKRSSHENDPFNFNNDSRETSRGSTEDFKMPDLEIRIPHADVLEQLTYVQEKILPAEIAYRTALKMIIRAVQEARSLFKEESEIDMSVKEKKTTISLETGIDDFISGSNARLRLGLRRIQVKGEVDIELPWDDGDLDLEAIAKIKPLNKMPLDRLRFQMKYKHPVLGGIAEVKGWLDFEPDEQNPYTFGVRARFNKLIYNNAHLGAEAYYMKEIGGEQDFGMTFGFQFTWGPGAEESPTDPYEGMDSDTRKLSAKLNPERLLTKAATRGQKAYQESLEE